MIPRVPAGGAAIAAAVGTGAAFGVALRASTDIFGAGPLSVLTVAAAAACAFRLPLPTRGPVRWLALPAIGAFVYAETCARLGFAIFGYAGGVFALAAALLVALALWALPFRPWIAVAGRPSWLLIVAVFALSPWIPREGPALVAIVCVAACIAAPRPARPRRVPSSGPAESAVAVVPVLAGVGLWCAGRSGLDPTPLGATALLAGALSAASLARGWPSALAGLATVGAAGWFIVLAPDDVVAHGVHAGVGVFAALGLGAGAVLGGLGIARATAPALVLVALALPSALEAVPPEWAESAARTRATTARDQVRAGELRDRATLRHAGLGPTGATSLRALGDGFFVELDGAFADPSSRAGDAERLAGVLAGCVAEGRGTARTGGDDLGLATAALRAQGFLHIDTALPDSRLARVQADALPSLAATWLHPAVRLVSLPAPAVLRAGKRADAVVEIARSPWSGGRSTLPDARGMRATRATLRPGGVHVLALAATGLDVDVFRGLLHAFVATWPGASLWLPPAGADTALLVGTDDRVPWARVQACADADPAGLRALSLHGPADLAALALADAAALRALPPGHAAPPGLPRELREPPTLHLSQFRGVTYDARALFGDDAPFDALAERAGSRAAFLDMLTEAATGDVREAIGRARSLSATPGGARAVEPLIRPHLERARAAIRRGAREGVTSRAWADAERELVTARMVFPEFPEIRCLEGELAGGRGQLPRAEESFEACAELDPDSIEAWEGLARVRRATGDRAGMEEALRAALRTHPNLPSAHQNLGVFLMEVGRYEDAEELLRKSAALHEREGKVSAEPFLALARLHLAMERSALALSEADRALTIQPSADAWALRGGARFSLGQVDVAEDDFVQALKLDPRNILALGGRAHVHAVRRDYALAATAWRDVLAIDPGNFSARENLARVGPFLGGGEGG